MKITDIRIEVVRRSVPGTGLQSNHRGLGFEIDWPWVEKHRIATLT